MLTITVHGLPAPQGSKRHVGHGIMVESCKRLPDWRRAVSYAAVEACERGLGGVRGAVDLNVTFTVTKPQSAPKRRRTYPDRKPDIDKLCRAVFDSLKDAGAIEDDARVVWLRAAKVYPGEGQDALPHPGAVIRVRGIEES